MRKLYSIALMGCGILVILIVVLSLDKEQDGIIYQNRSFFGTVKVKEVKLRNGVIHEFYHGTTLHGLQVFSGNLQRYPTTYFGPDCGGMAIIQHPKYEAGQPMEVCLVGMGIGTMCAYGRTGDRYSCLEINPDVVELATDPSLFTFISDSKAMVLIQEGDARTTLELERDHGTEKYDVIVIDAFTGDNIPKHLCTKEAFDLYFERLKPDGIIAIHLSNKYLFLPPLAKAIQKETESRMLVLRLPTNERKMRQGCLWGYYTKSSNLVFDIPEDADVMNPDLVKDFDLPTDEKGSFISLIRKPW